MKRRYVLIALALVATLSLASPALGGPSLAGLSKGVKQAYRLAKQADRRALVADARSRQNRELIQRLAPAQMNVVRSDELTVPPYSVRAIAALCPNGERVISGGGHFVSGFGSLYASEPNFSGTGWVVAGHNRASIDAVIQVVAHCAPTGRAISSRAARAEDRASTRRQIRRLEDQMRQMEAGR